MFLILYLRNRLNYMRPCLSNNISHETHEIYVHWLSAYKNTAFVMLSKHGLANGGKLLSTGHEKVNTMSSGIVFRRKHLTSV